MLPFLKPKQIGSIVQMKKTDSGMMPEKEEGEATPDLHMIAEDLISAVHMKDAKGVADALEAAFMSLDSDDTEESAE